MPAIHRAGRFRIVIYTNDHLPVHVHAIANSEMAKITLECPDGDPKIASATDGISPPELRRLKNEVANNRDKFLKEWSKIHGDPCETNGEPCEDETE